MTAVAVILKGYPRLSETFIAQEILALQRRGLDLRIVSLRHPTDREINPVHREITAPVSYLPEYLHSEPLRVLHGFATARKLPGYAHAHATWRHDLARDRPLALARSLALLPRDPRRSPPGWRAWRRSG